MSIVIRPELSKRNPYRIDKHRYYELKHFCLQYPVWKRIYSELDGFRSSGTDVAPSKNISPSDPTAQSVEKRLYYLEKMETVEQAAIESDPELATYILRAVTEELSYTYLKARLDIPCSRDTYYDRYRRFFWLLSKRKNHI